MRRFAEPDAPASVGVIFSRSSRQSSAVNDSLPMLSVEQAAFFARSFFSEAMREMDAEPRPPAGWSANDAAVLRAELETSLARLTGPQPVDGIDDVADAMHTLLRNAGLQAVHGSDACNSLHNLMRRAMAQIATIRLARSNGDYSDTITDRAFLLAAHGERPPPALYHEGNAPVGVVIERLQTASDAYLEQLLKTPKSLKTEDRYRSEMRHIVRFFGADTPVWKINATECDRFRDTFSALPPNFEDWIRRGHSIAEIAARQSPDAKRLAWATLDKYLSQLSRFIKWSHKRDYVAKSYGDDLKPLAARPEGSMAKLPFDDEELRRVFVRPIYTGCKDDERGFSTSGDRIVRRSRYWAPLIALYSGLRCSEILQLTTEHFRVSPGGRDFIVLTPDMKLKNENAVREVPVHEMLKRIGLIEWVERRRDGQPQPLFPEVPSHSKYGDRSTRFSKWFQSDLKYFELGHRRSKLTFHSFRHTFKRALDRADVREDKKDELCGWSRGKKVGRRYGSGLEADVLASSVDAVFYNVNLEHLFAHANLQD